MVEVLSSDFLKMLQATISLRGVCLQLPAAKLDLDQAYQDRDAENAIGYNTPNTIFVYNPIKFNLGCFLKLFYVLFISHVLFLFVSSSPSQQKPMPQTEAVA